MNNFGGTGRIAGFFGPISVPIAVAARPAIFFVGVVIEKASIANERFYPCTKRIDSVVKIVRAVIKIARSMMMIAKTDHSIIERRRSIARLRSSAMDSNRCITLSASHPFERDRNASRSIDRSGEAYIRMPNDLP